LKNTGANSQSYDFWVVTPWVAYRVLKTKIFSSTLKNALAY
jgi:hypothetical protein